MAKFDAVDRLMKLAGQKANPGGRQEAARDPEKVVAAQGDAAEPGTPSGMLPQPAEKLSASPGERGRQLLGAIRPLLPAVGGALRMVDHGAVQAVARLLPLLGSVRTGSASGAGFQAAPAPGPSQASSNRERSVLEGELTALRARADIQEEQIRRLREALERMAAEQSSLSHLAHGLESRVRLLTAGVLILLVLAIAEAVLLAISLSR